MTVNQYGALDFELKESTKIISGAVASVSCPNILGLAAQ